MTIQYADVLTALKMDNGVQMRRTFELMNISEQVEVGTFIGPDRLVAVARHGDWSSDPDGENAKITSANLAEISRQAFNAPLTDLSADIAALIDPWRKQVIKTSLVRVEQRRMTAPLLTMPEDVTGTLPVPNGVPAPLSESDYAAAAKETTSRSLP